MTPSQMLSFYFGIHNQNIISAINIFVVLNYSVNEEIYNFFQMKYAKYRPKEKMKACRKKTMLKINFTTKDLLNHPKCCVLIHSVMCRY